jgi:hypothetical protein
MKWKREDVEFASKIEAIAAKAALRLLGKIEKHAQDNFAAANWILERRFPQVFARPEVQLNLIQQNNATVNALSITISPEEIREIEAVAKPTRQKVRQMLEEYQSRRGNGDQETSGSVSKAVEEKFANYRPGSGNGK